MNRFFLCLTILLPVIVVGCLQHPHIQTYTFKTFMIRDALDIIVLTLSHFTFSDIYLTTADAFSVRKHWFTLSTLAPVILFHTKRLYSSIFVPVSIIMAFLSVGSFVVTSTLSASLATGSYM